MSRIHAFLIAIFVTGAVAVGAATAFTVSNAPTKPGSGLSNEVLQARAAQINKAEKKLAKRLKENPEPDRSAITKVITVGGSGTAGTSGSTTSSSGSDDHSGSTTSARHESEDRFDDHGGDRHESDDHSGSDSSGHGGGDD